jgi:hypothetical protein
LSGSVGSYADSVARGKRAGGGFAVALGRSGPSDPVKARADGSDTSDLSDWSDFLVDSFSKNAII